MLPVFVAFRDQVEFGRRLARRVGDEGFDLGKRFFQIGLEELQLLAGEDFYHEIAAFPEDDFAKLERLFGQFVGVVVVLELDARKVRGHVGEHDIDLPSQVSQQKLARALLADVAHDEGHVLFGERREILQVDADDVPEGADFLGGHLDPATRGTAQVDDQRSLFKDAESLVHLHQFEGRSRT